MSKRMKKDSGSALALVLIFVTVLGGWLGVVLLVSQASTSGIQRLNMQTSNSSQAAAATATVLEKLTNDPTLGSSAFTPVTQPNCGLPSTINGVTVICTPVTGGTQPLASNAVEVTGPDTGTTPGVDKGITVTGSHDFDSPIKSTGSSSNITISTGTVKVPKVETKDGASIPGVTGTTVKGTGTSSDLATSQSVPVLPVGNPGTGISGSLNSVLPATCKGLDSTITIPSGDYNDEAIDQLNQLFSYDIIRTYQSNGSFTDRDCSQNNTWKHKEDIALGRGEIHFTGTKVLKVLKDKDDPSESISIHNEASDAVVTNDSSGNPTGCSYLHGLTATSPMTSSDVSGTQLAFGGAATFENDDGDVKICGPHVAVGQSIAIISLDASHESVCAAVTGSSAKCPALHTGTTPLFYAKGKTSTGSSGKSYIYGTVLASGSSVQIDESSSKQHEIDGGIVANGAKFSCTAASACAFPVKSGPAVTGRHLKITLRCASGAVFEHEIIADDNSGLNPASHFSITSLGS
jgi:hypothetical protein